MSVTAKDSREMPRTYWERMLAMSPKAELSPVGEASCPASWSPVDPWLAPLVHIL